MFIHVAGTEDEQDIHDPTGKVTAKVLLAMLAEHARHFGVCLAENNFRGYNGSRAYQDVAAKAEYATAECLDGTEAAIHEVAGSLLWALMAHLADKDLGRPNVTRILKTNTCSNGDSGGGNHLNVSMPLGELTFHEAFARVVARLKPFVATLQLLTGSGVVLPPSRAETRLGGDNYAFAISPRAFHVTEDARSGASTSSADGNKPIFMERDEPHGHPGKFWRLQISGLDSNILFSAIQLKLDLMLLMAEMVVADAVQEMQLVEDSPSGHSARRISLDWRTPLQTSFGIEMTPLEVQWHYYRQAEKFVLHHPGRWQPVLDQWAGLLAEFDTPDDIPAALYGKVDWVTKALMLQRAEVKAKKLHEADPSAPDSLTYQRAEDLHFLYHGYRIPNRSDKGLCIPLMLLDRYGPPGVVEQVIRALDHPPINTRAWGRSQFLRLLPAGATIDWGWVRPGNNAKLLKLHDPAAAITPGLNHLIHDLRAAA